MRVTELLGTMSALHFLRPFWLWCLLLVPVLAWWRQRRRRRDSVWRGAVDAHLLPHLLDARGGMRLALAPWLLLTSFALGIVALAGPSWREVEQPLLQNDAPLVVALDLSSRALADDLPPSRTLQMRAKIATLLKERRGGQVGLVAFADDAYTVAPLTDDTANVALFLDALSPDVMPVDGSNAARAVAQAAALIRQAGFATGDILVLSDHADGDARTAAARASGDGYRVSVLGVGTANGAAYRKPSGDIAHAELDAPSLEGLATAGGGRYVAMRADDGDLAALGLLEAGATTATVARGDKVGVRQDDGYWLLLPAMLLALFAFRRGSGVAVLLLTAWLPLYSARAAEGDGTLWRRADQVEHARMQSGADAYRRNAFDAAAQAWKAVPGADADYNRGNALAKAGRYEDAIAAYDDALRKQPAMADAQANRTAVERALKQKPPAPSESGRNDQRQGEGGKPQDGPSDPQDSQSGRSPSGGQSGNASAPKASSQPQGEPPPQTPQQKSDADRAAQADPAKPPNADAAQTQRAADAQQRARMQQALRRNAQGEQARDGAKAAAQAGPRETAQAREQRQATEAWLRRVPDDPGGLLRAKFRLEYERRENTGER